MNDDEQQHLQELKETYRKRLRRLELQEANQGMYSRPELLNEIDEVRAKIAKLDEQLHIQHTIILKPQDYSQQLSLRSLEGKIQTFLKFVNQSSQPIKLYWIDYLGEQKVVTVLAPGESNTQKTYISHPFVIATMNDRNLVIYMPVQEPAVALIMDAHFP